MVDEMANWQILFEFLRIWDRPANLQGNEQIAIVPCNLTYMAKGSVKHVATQANVYVKEGRINLFEEDWFNPEDYYSEFDVRWQKFSLTPSQSLRIEGTGPKLGRYWVEITPQISN